MSAKRFPRCRKPSAPALTLPAALVLLPDAWHARRFQGLRAGTGG